MHYNRFSLLKTILQRLPERLTSHICRWFTHHDSSILPRTTVAYYEEYLNVQDFFPLEQKGHFPERGDTSLLTISLEGYR